MTIVNFRNPNPLLLRVVDMTCNGKGWEYDVSQQIYDDLKAKGIPISGKRETPRTIATLQASLQGDFSAVLIFAHGAKSKDGVSADKLSITNNWFLFSSLNIDLSDKFVSLCICEGYCNDMIASLVRGELFALTVVASEKKILRSEALGFFPTFFERLVKKTKRYIDPNDVRACMNKTNSLSSGKMKIYSDGLSYTKASKHASKVPSNWIDIFKTVFANIQETLPIILNCDTCRELWLQGEIFRLINRYDLRFKVNEFPIEPHKKADFHGFRYGEMVGELKVYGLSGYYQKNIYGAHNIEEFIPKKNNGRILIKPSHLKNVDLNESSILKDYIRIKAISNKIDKFLILVVHKNGQKDNFGQAISALRFPGIEQTLDFPYFFVRIWKI